MFTFSVFIACEGSFCGLVFYHIAKLHHCISVRNHYKRVLFPSSRGHDTNLNNKDMGRRFVRPSPELTARLNFSKHSIDNSNSNLARVVNMTVLSTSCMCQQIRVNQTSGWFHYNSLGQLPLSAGVLSGRMDVR